MAFAATTIWEVQETGDDDNGGAFDSSASGDDYTQGTYQQTQEWASSGGDYTNDLAATDASPSVLTSAARGVAVGGNGFTSGDEGNAIKISAGTNFVAGWYQIVSVDGSGNATLDRNCCSGGAGSAGSGILGGALATPGGLGAALDAVGVSGMKGYIKKGASDYTLTTATLNVSGGPISLGTTMLDKWCLIKGYETSRDDYYPDADRPAINAGAINSGSVVTMGGNTNTRHLHNIEIDGNSNSLINGIAISPGGNVDNYCYRVEVRHCDGSRGFLSVRCIACKAYSNNAIGFQTCMCYGCWADANGLDGFSGSQYYQQINCIATNNGGDGFTGSDAFCINCVAYNNSGDGFQPAVTTSPITCINCISYGNSGYGFNNTQNTMLLNCATGNNSSGRYNATPPFDLGAITLTLSDTDGPFTDPTNGDFSLDPTSADYDLLKAAATSPYAQDSYLDVGAVQHEDTGGGGATLIIKKQRRVM